MCTTGVSSHGGQEHARHSMMPQSHAKAGDVFWGKAEDLLFGGGECLHSRVDMESSDPRRKLPGGQSSPQSLRGIASIVEPIWCMEKVRRRAIICNMHIPAASWQWRHRSQSGAETMGLYFWKDCSTACVIIEGAQWHPSNHAVSSVHSCWYTISSSRHLIHHPAPTLFNTTIVIQCSYLSCHFSLATLLYLRLRRIALVELDAHRIDAMSLVRRRRVSLALEYMSQMASTVAAHNLRPLHAESAVGVPCHGARDSVEESRPAAARLELVLRGVDGCLAAGASVGS